MDKEKIFYEINKEVALTYPSVIRLYKLVAPEDMYNEPEPCLPKIVLTNWWNQIINIAPNHCLPRHAYAFYLGKENNPTYTIDYHYSINRSKTATLLRTTKINTFIAYTERSPIPILKEPSNILYERGDCVFKAAYIDSWSLKHKSNSSYKTAKKRKITLYEIAESKEIDVERNPDKPSGLIKILIAHQKEYCTALDKITEEYLNKYKQEILNNQILFPV